MSHEGVDGTVEIQRAPQQQAVLSSQLRNHHCDKTVRERLRQNMQRTHTENTHRTQRKHDMCGGLRFGSVLLNLNQLESLIEFHWIKLSSFLSKVLNKDPVQI